MNKYCCVRFENQVVLPKESGLNIRILRFSENELISNKNLYRFFITPGYSSSDRGVPTFNIAYCPFCGENLFQYYKSDSYVNENDSDFLYL